MGVDPVELLQGLISISSVSGQEDQASRFLVARMTRLGMDAFVDDAGNAVGRRAVPDETGRIKHQIMLLGHIDTVPGEIPVRIEDGKLYGRGSVDAKGPLATFVMAAAGAELSPGTEVVVIGAVEEECATSAGARFVADQYHPDWCIIGEPSGWNGITLGYKGRYLMRYYLRQPMEHSAGPDMGAADRAVAWWQRVLDYAHHFNQGRERYFDQLLPALRAINSDSDGLINEVVVEAGLRLPPGFDAAVFETLAREWAGDARLECDESVPAYQGDRQNPLARSLSLAIRENGGRPQPRLKTGTSDMNIVGPRWGCPILAYGPGDSRLDHTPGEHILLDDYFLAIRVLRAVLERGQLVKERLRRR